MALLNEFNERLDAAHLGDLVLVGAITASNLCDGFDAFCDCFMNDGHRIHHREQWSNTSCLADGVLRSPLTEPVLALSKHPQGGRRLDLRLNIAVR